MAGSKVGSNPALTGESADPWVDTLIVWTEPSTGLDIALSFQDAEGCEDIWQFICEVQRHLNCQPRQSAPPIMCEKPPADHAVEESAPGPSSSSPLTASPMLGSAFAALSGQDSKTTWQTPTLANIKSVQVSVGPVRTG